MVRSVVLYIAAMFFYSQAACAIGEEILLGQIAASTGATLKSVAETLEINKKMMDKLDRGLVVASAAQRHEALTMRIVSKVENFSGPRGRKVGDLNSFARDVKGFKSEMATSGEEYVDSWALADQNTKELDDAEAELKVLEAEAQKDEFATIAGAASEQQTQMNMANNTARINKTMVNQLRTGNAMVRLQAALVKNDSLQKGKEESANKFNTNFFQPK